MEPPHRIAHVIDVLDFGGVENMALLLLQRLPRRRFDAGVEDVVLELVPRQALQEQEGHVLHATEVEHVDHVGDAVRGLHAASLRLGGGQGPLLYY